MIESIHRAAWLASAALTAACVFSCSQVPRRPAGSTARSNTAFWVSDRDLGPSPRFVVYGDMRFTAATETKASQPGPRQMLIARIEVERPDVVFLTGDVPWHGGSEADYRVYTHETAAWRKEQLRVYSVLGNHEFKGCLEAACLAHWWQAFPEQAGRRWYDVALGSQLLLVALDSESSFLPDSEQGQWLQGQLAALPASVRFVVFLLHHPLMTDAKDGVRSNEASLMQQLVARAPVSDARFVVCAAHVHNYERFQRDGIVILVSGGGGGRPEAVKRSAADLYQTEDFPNFHYLRFELVAGQLRGEMVRMADADSAAGPSWSVRDRFEVKPKGLL